MVDGVGWEALTSESIDEYFSYIKSKENDLWIATFADATKYMRERMNADVKSSEKNGKITITLTHTLDKSIYDIPLTLKSYVSPEWKEVVVKQGDEVKRLRTQQQGKETYVLYQAVPNGGDIYLSGV